MHDAILLKYIVVHPPDERPHGRDPDKDLKKDVDPDQMYAAIKPFYSGLWSQQGFEIWKKI